MAQSATAAANCALIDAVFGTHPELSDPARDLMKFAADPCNQITDTLLERVRAIVAKKEAASRKP